MTLSSFLGDGQTCHMRLLISNTAGRRQRCSFFKPLRRAGRAARKHGPLGRPAELRDLADHCFSHVCATTTSTGKKVGGLDRRIASSILLSTQPWGNAPCHGQETGPISGGPLSRAKREQRPTTSFLLPPPPPLNWRGQARHCFCALIKTSWSVLPGPTLACRTRGRRNSPLLLSPLPVCLFTTYLTLDQQQGWAGGCRASPQRLTDVTATRSTNNNNTLSTWQKEAISSKLPNHGRNYGLPWPWLESILPTISHHVCCGGDPGRPVSCMGACVRVLDHLHGTMTAKREELTFLASHTPPHRAPRSPASLLSKLLF